MPSRLLSSDHQETFLVRLTVKTVISDWIFVLRLVIAALLSVICPAIVRLYLFSYGVINFCPLQTLLVRLCRHFLDLEVCLDVTLGFLARGLNPPTSFGSGCL